MRSTLGGDIHEGDGGANALRGRGDKVVAMDRPPIDLKSRKVGDGPQVINGQSNSRWQGMVFKRLDLYLYQPSRQA